MSKDRSRRSLFGAGVCMPTSRHATARCERLAQYPTIAYRVEVPGA